MLWNWSVQRDHHRLRWLDVQERVTYKLFLSIFAESCMLYISCRVASRILLRSGSVCQNELIVQRHKLSSIGWHTFSGAALSVGVEFLGRLFRT